MGRKPRNGCPGEFWGNSHKRWKNSQIDGNITIRKGSEPVADLFDYLAWRGDLRFSQDPPNAVDALIFSGLAYIRYGDSVAKEPNVPVSLRDAAEEFFGLPDREERVLLKKDLDLL